MAEALASSRVALVTGAARGLGFSIAQHLARQGHRVVLGDALPEVDEAAAGLASQGLSVRAVRLDVGDPEAIARFPAELGDWWRDVAILVNNAGISPKVDGRKRNVEEIELAEWRRVLDVNLTSAFLLSKSCIPAMKSAGWGRIVMMASQAAFMASAITGAYYGVTKAGLVSLARDLAAELGPFGITVNSIAPGRIATPMVAGAAQGVNETYLRTIPLGRMGAPRDVANAVGFLVSDEAAYVTGDTIHVGGGAYMP